MDFDPDFVIVIGLYAEFAKEGVLRISSTSLSARLATKFSAARPCSSDLPFEIIPLEAIFMGLGDNGSPS